jgi:hypothetical protein
VEGEVEEEIEEDWAEIIAEEERANAELMKYTTETNIDKDRLRQMSESGWGTIEAFDAAQGSSADIIPDNQVFDYRGADLLGNRVVISKTHTPFGHSYFIPLNNKQKMAQVTPRPMLPDAVQALLTIRVGQPYGKSRGGWKEDISFLISDGANVLKQKCYSRFERVKAAALQRKKIKLNFSMGSLPLCYDALNCRIQDL